MKKAHESELFLMIFGRSTRIRTLDPLVPNQVRYQTAPHSDKLQIIARTDTFSVSGFPFFLAPTTQRQV